MSAIAAGDQKAFAELLERYLNKVHHFILRSTNAPGDTDDLVQETFLRVWSKAQVFAAEQASVSTWLMRIARNLCIDNHRRTQARPAGHEVSDGESHLEFMAVEERSAGNELQHQRALGQLRRAISALPERQRTALTLCQLQGRTNAEAAAILGIQTAAIESLLARARRALREALRESDRPTGQTATFPEPALESNRHNK